MGMGGVLMALLGTVVGADPGHPAKNGRCAWEGRCPIGKDNPAHFDPYYNGHLCENFDPKQVDFASTYESLRSRKQSKLQDRLPEVGGMDFSGVWLSGGWAQDGVLGGNYRRIEIHVDHANRKAGAPRVYEVRGRSRVGRNVVAFRGEIELVHLYGTECDDPARKGCGDLFGRYVFREDSAGARNGVFRGVVESWVVVGPGGRGVLDTSDAEADGYWNRSYVGTWTEYVTENVKTCIWGDRRLPFTFDFDCGDGEMVVCDRYVSNGWRTFNAHAETIETPDGRREPKDKWWLATERGSVR